MSALVPLFIAIVIIGIVFIFAMKRGVVSMLSGGIAAFSSLIVLFGTVNFLPLIVESTVGINLTWKLVLIVAVIFGVISYLIFRIIAGSLVGSFFDPDGWFNSMTDGFFGGIISLIPALVVVLFVFVCIRVAGTFQELNYVDSISQPGIESTPMDFPDWPLTTHWRDTLEKIPFFSTVYDLIEPFSRRQNRNLAALVTIRQSAYQKSILKKEMGVGPLIDLADVIEVSQNEQVIRALQKRNQLDLVMSSFLQKEASKALLKTDLQELQIRKMAEAVIGSLPKN